MRDKALVFEPAGEELLFFAGVEELLTCYLRFRMEIIAFFPESGVRVQKSQISFRCPRPYAWVWTLARHGSGKAGSPSMFVTFAAPFPVESPLIHMKTAPYPGRWTHHVAVSKAEDITPELMSLVQASHAFRNTAVRKDKGGHHDSI